MSKTSILFFLILTISSSSSSEITHVNPKLPDLEFNQLYIGYSKQNIDPQEPKVPMGGYGNSKSRLSQVDQTFSIPLHATITVILDREKSGAVLITMDSLSLGGDLQRVFKNAIKDETNIPVENITISNTHSHSTPDLGEDTQVIKNHRELVKSKLVAGVVEALEDLWPAYAEVGKIKVVKENGENALNFVRHYTTTGKEKDGRPITRGDNHGNFAWDAEKQMIVFNGHKGYVSVADNNLQLIKFTFQKEGKKDVILANFQTHPHTNGCSSCYILSSDIAGAFIESLEAKVGCRAAYFSGASGNVNPGTPLTDGIAGIEGVTYNYSGDKSKSEIENNYIRAKKYGKILSEYAEKVIPNMKRVALSEIKHRESKVKNYYRLFSAEEVKNANYMKKIWDLATSASYEDVKKMICGTYDWGEDFVFPDAFNKTGEKLRYLINTYKHLIGKMGVEKTEDNCTFTEDTDITISNIHGLLKIIGFEFEKHIEGPYHANRIVSSAKYESGANKEVKLRTLTIGKIAFAAAPYEMFHENGIDIKENSKAEMTFVLYLADGSEGYMPSKKAYEYGCYEADTSPYYVGCAEAFADEFVNMINEDVEKDKNYTFIIKEFKNVECVEGILSFILKGVVVYTQDDVEFQAKIIPKGLKLQNGLKLKNGVNDNTGSNIYCSIIVTPDGKELSCASDVSIDAGSIISLMGDGVLEDGDFKMKVEYSGDVQYKMKDECKETASIPHLPQKSSGGYIKYMMYMILVGLLFF